MLNFTVSKLLLVFVHQGFGLVLGLLIVVGGGNRRVFVGRGIFDIAMHPAGAAVNESLYPGRNGSIENYLGAADVNLVIISVGHIELAKGSSEMVHNVNARHRFFDHRGIRDAADNDLDAPIANFAGFDPFFVIQCNNVMPIVM